MLSIMRKELREHSCLSWVLLNILGFLVASRITTAITTMEEEVAPENDVEDLTGMEVTVCTARRVVEGAPTTPSHPVVALDLYRLSAPRQTWHPAVAHLRDLVIFGVLLFGDC